MDKYKKHYFKCTRRACFAERGGKCSLLTRRTKRQPCPFYRAIDELQMEDVKLYGYIQHEKLVDPEGC